MQSQSTNEAGTPVYSVTVQESRRVTMSRTFTVLGGTPHAAKIEAEQRAARGWQQLAELGGFSLGQVEGDAAPVPAALARRLLDWAEQMGGWDAPVWAELRAHFEGEPGKYQRAATAYGAVYFASNEPGQIICAMPNGESESGATREDAARVICERHNLTT